MRRSVLAGIVAAVALSCACGNVFSPGDPLPPPPPIGDSAALVQALADTYRSQASVKFAALLADDFHFVEAPNPAKTANPWNRETELLVHRRMFDPERIPTSEPPLPEDLWLQTVFITITPRTSFDERTDLYTTAEPAGPLDPTRWIARGAVCTTDVFFQLRGETDYQVFGDAKFVVVEDRSKQIGDTGKFLLYHWEDMGMPAATLGVEDAAWGTVKRLFL